MEEWYYTQNGEQQGPVNLGALRDMAQEGTLKPDDMVWNSSMKDWTKASEVGGIFSGGISQTPSATASAEASPDQVDPANLEEIEPGSDPLDIGTVFSRTLDLTKKNFLTIFLMGLIVFGVSMGFNIISQVLMAVSGAAGSHPQPTVHTFNGADGFQQISYQHSEAAALPIAMLLIYILVQVVSSVVNLWLSLGLTRACLNLVDGKQAEVSMLFSQADKILRAIGASILVCLIVIVGLIMLIIPGIYLMIKLSMVIPAIVDRNMGVMDAINYSFRITKGNGLMIFLLWFLALILMIIAIVITCGMGAIVAGPIFTLGWVLCYRWMQYGRKVAQ